jgi:vancomycin resistance protein YoaR
MHQKLNIERAVAKLNGTILRPGERFSFNKLVGPRNSRAGFFSAPSYIGAASYDTLGGGICVISSALYQDALLADLKVIERVPHLRTMQTVEPGLDATVWSGGADLKFINDSSTPIQLCCKLENGCLETSLLGSEIPSVHRQLRRRELQGAHNQIAVEVFKESSSDARDKIAEKTNKIKLVSRDIYFVNSPKHVPQTKPTSNL